MTNGLEKENDPTSVAPPAVAPPAKKDRHVVTWTPRVSNICFYCSLTSELLTSLSMEVNAEDTNQSSDEAWKVLIADLEIVVDKSLVLKCLPFYLNTRTDEIVVTELLVPLPETILSLSPMPKDEIVNGCTSSEFTSPLQTIPLFQSFSDGIPTPAFTSSVSYDFHTLFVCDPIF
ncbi:hypothetical protein B296_00010265 [Ensete ventricosum]|uniref:Uncharacterized protein n=1 Tax=Ensete ventricosum TaxID=4639 RepID=A0A427AXW9_ENSVE|nr:hypothetical protein B296_00010265 [Ensete ventricosum]